MIPTLTKKSFDWLSFTVLFVIITVVFHIIFGLSVLLPENINWLMSVRGDWGCYYLGWAFYRDEPWTLPLGYMQNYGYPVDHNVAMTDGIPLLSMVSKIVSPLLPPDFQLYGLWMLSCHILAAWFALKILELLHVNKTIAVAGALMIGLNPVLITRNMHFPLTAHWLILASFYNYLKPSNSNNVRNINLKQSIIIAITSVTNIYITVMVTVISGVIAIKQRYFDKSLSTKQMIGTWAVYGSIILIIWLLVGIIAFGGVTASLTSDFGPHSTNLNSFFNSLDLSSIPGMKVFRSEQGEGFAYLGLGFIILSVISVVYLSYQTFKTSRIELRETVRQHYLYVLPLALTALAFFIFALSHQVTWFDKTLFTVPLPGIVLRGLSMFKGNGRFIWPLYYLILIYSIYFFSRIKLRRQVIIGFFFFIAAVEAYDLVPALLQFKPILAKEGGTYNPPLAKDSWVSLIEKFDAVITYPPNQKTMLKDMDYQDLAFVSLLAHKPISAGYYARNSLRANEAFQQKIAAQINEGKIEKNYLFVTTEEYLNVFRKLVNMPDYDLQQLDGYWLVFKKNTLITYSLFQTDIDKKNRLVAEMNGPNRIVFPNGISYNNRMVYPMWDNDWITSNTFQFKKGNYILKFNAFGTAVNDEFPVIEVAVNGKIIGKFNVVDASGSFEAAYTNESDTDAIVMVHMINDVNIPGKGDRNAFAEKIELKEVNEGLKSVK